MIRYLWNLVLVCFLMFVFCKSNEKVGSQNSIGPKDFTLTSLEGEEITISKLKDKVVLVDFWATWCPPCRNSIPFFINLYNKYNDQGFTVLGISLEDKPLLIKYRDKHNIPYPILLGNKDIAIAYDVQAIPKMFIIDKKGKIRKTQVGFAPELESKLESLIDSLLKE